jgi:hypothetical protein
LLTVFTVTNTASAGAGSLWQAITDSNAAGGQNTIQFDIGSGGQQTILLTGFNIGQTYGVALPTITSSVTIDGTSQPGYAGTPLIELDGQGNAGYGLSIGASNSKIIGLDVVRVRFVDHPFATGISLDATASHTTIEDCFFGADAYGSGGLFNDLNISAGSAANVIQHNFFGPDYYNSEIPSVGSVSTSNGVTTVMGSVSAATGTTLTINFYDDLSASSQGRLLLGSTTVTTASGKASFSAALNQPLPAGDSLAVSATDSNHNTYGTNPMGTAHERYVSAVYQDVLDRAPDANGLAYWVQSLDQGTAVSSVAEAIAHSDEYYANFVIRPDYLKLLGRSADDAGVGHWTAQMDAGATDQQLEADLVSSSEFYQNAGGTNISWIDAVYKLLLGRQADKSGETYWNGQLAAHQTLNQVAQRIASSQENNTQLINDDYFHYLGRGADPQGLAFWLSQFSAGKTNEDVIAGFTGSSEYYRDHTS